MDILLSAMAKAGDGPSGMNSAHFHHCFDEDAAKLGIEEAIGEGSDFRQMDEKFFDADAILASALAAVGNCCPPSSSSSSTTSSLSNTSLNTLANVQSICDGQQPSDSHHQQQHANANNAFAWSRSAGRKKSHPVWAFFRDLRDSNGVGGVCCLHCEWTGDDRSPNNLRTHLKRFHEADGVFKQFTQELAMTPTQPYVKRKRHQQQQQGQTQNEQQSAEAVLQSAQVQDGQPTASPSPAAVPKKSPSPAVMANNQPAVMQLPAQSIPHSGAQSAFSKYSTAALLQQSQEEGKKSPAHGEEAPKPRSAQFGGGQQQLSLTRANYGLEAMTGLNTQQLSMLGLADPQLMAQLETAAAMSQLVQLQQQAEKNAVVQQQTQRPQQTQPNAQQQQQQQLNDLLALYAASAAAASALQQQQQEGLKAKNGQQQLAAQQVAAAAWLYNWEWLAAAQRMGLAQNGSVLGVQNGLNGMQNGTATNSVLSSAASTSLAIAPTTTTMTTAQQPKAGQQQQQQNAAAAAMAAALGLGGFNNGAAMLNGQQKQQAAAQQSAADAMLARAAMSQLLIQTQAQQAKQQQQPAQNKERSSMAQKRKSPTTTQENTAPVNSLHVLADTAASTAAVEQRMQQQREDGGSPAKQARKEPPVAATAGEREKALAESLVLYGMHRIAMELQLSYSVHANKQGRAEYAFYCTAGANGNANIQRMVTLTESADQILHLREYANGTVVAEECWPKSAEPCSLLHSLRDKCQRRLCSAQ